MTDEEFTRLLGAARRFAGDTDEPLTDEERAVMEEVRAAKRKPSRKEIAAMVKAMTKRSD